MLLTFALLYIGFSPSFAMEETSRGGKLQKVAAFARFIDNTIAELERGLSSAHSLLPDESHHEEAHSYMQTLLEEITIGDVSYPLVAVQSYI